MPDNLFPTVSPQVAQPHPNVVATDKWIDERYQVDNLLARLEKAAGVVREAEDELRRANAALREAEERLEDLVASVGYPVNIDPKFKNGAQRDAAIGKLLQESAEWHNLRRVVEHARQVQEAAKSALRQREEHQKNMRVYGEIFAAKLRAIAR